MKGLRPFGLIALVTLLPVHSLLPAAVTVPTANDDVAETDNLTPVFIDVLANDFDPDGVVLTVTVEGTPPTCGTIINNHDGSLVFLPAGGFEGDCVFSYTLSDGQDSDTAQVTVTVTPGGMGSGPPVITGHPFSTETTKGGTAFFTVVATGEQPLIYQWRHNDVPIEDGGHFHNATTAQLTITEADVSVTGSYSCTVSNALGAATSNSATLTIETDAMGPLVHLPGHRYFTAPSGRDVFLTGSHTWDNLQDWGDHRPDFNYTAYLNLMEDHNHNFMRLWVWETHTAGDPGLPNQNANPLPYVNNGSLSNLSYDLDSFNQAYFDRLRNRVIQARDRGIYVGVMLWQGFSTYHKPFNDTEYPWDYHPFNENNNGNGVDGDLNDNNDGEEFHTYDFDSANPQVQDLVSRQKAYVMKVIDTLNDLDNVLWEIGNELIPDATQWSHDMIDFIHGYEASKPFQHPVGMTSYGFNNTNSNLFNSNAEWISPARINPDENYAFDPPAATGQKVILADNDHIQGILGSTNPDTYRQWTWKNLTRGINTILMDAVQNRISTSTSPAVDPDNPAFPPARRYLGDAHSYAQRVDLNASEPMNALSSTGYCLANPGISYIVYQPGSGSFTVDLDDASYLVEWFNPRTSETASGGTPANGSTFSGTGVYTFNPPSGTGDWVLYLAGDGQPPEPEPNLRLVHANRHLSSGDTVHFFTATGVPAVRTFTLTNTGTAVLSIDQFGIKGKGFDHNLTVPLDLAPGTSHNFTVTFTYATPFSATAMAEMVSNDPDEEDFLLVLEAEAIDAPPCVANSETLCLQGDRFSASLTWDGGTSGTGQAAPQTDETGVFWFFNQTNPEVAVKVLDGIDYNGFSWVFHGAMTGEAYTLTVTDLWTGTTKTYLKPQGSFCGDTDVVAFPGSPGQATKRGESLLPETPVLPILTELPTVETLAFRDFGGYGEGVTDECIPSATELCLQQERFRVALEFVHPNTGQSTHATTHPYSGEAGFFWFFGDQNLEVGVKVLDATQGFGQYWVFIGSLTTIEYTVTVTDTVSGNSQAYSNAAGDYCGQADTGAFPSDPNVNLTVNLEKDQIPNGGNLGFGNPGFGQPVTHTLTLGNFGSDPLVISDISIPDNTQYSVVGPELPITISPRRSESIDVVLAATRPGLQEGTLTILSNDYDDSPYLIDLSGTVGDAPPCPNNDQTLCLQNGRFSATLTYENAYGTQTADAEAQTNAAGVFWFNNFGNAEVLVKVLDGTGDNGAWWVLHGAMTGLAYTLTVTDIWNGTTNTYTKPQGTFCGGADFSGFPDLPGAPAAPPPNEVLSKSAVAELEETLTVTAIKVLPFPDLSAKLGTAGTCSPSNTTLCFQNNRFEVVLDFVDPGNQQTTAAQTHVYSDESGFFTFFGPQNLEVGVKVLDGTGQNGNFWVFIGSTTGADYTVRVRDTVTAVEQTYASTGVFCGEADTESFPGFLSLEFTSQPEPQVALLGGEAGFSIAAAGGIPPYTYDWLYSTTGQGGTFSVIPGTNSDTLTLDPVALGDAGFYRCRVRDSRWPKDPNAKILSVPAELTVIDPPPCPTNNATLCLREGRFQATLTYSGNSSGTGTAVALTEASGMFWFYGQGNAEVLVKVLDGTGENGNYWVFHGAMTDQPYALTVTDLWTGISKTFNKPIGSFCGEADTGTYEEFPGLLNKNANPSTGEDARQFLAEFDQTLGSGNGVAARAFPAAPGTRKAGTCTPSNTALCMQNNRFRVEMDFVHPTSGQVTSARTHAYSDQSGFFNFFGPDNLEVGVKVLDATLDYGYYWVFFGSTTGVDYTLRVTDTETGAQQTYAMPGPQCGFGDTEAFPSYLPLAVDQQPESDVVLLGDPASLSVSVNGGVQPYAYQWKYSASGQSGTFTDIAGGTGATLHIDPTDFGDSGFYRCRVRDATWPSDPAGQLNSGIAELLVIDPPDCPTNANTLCLRNGRFKATLTYSGNSSGTGTAVALTNDSGIFWFYGQANAEVMVKVLDGTGLNGNYWVFHGPMTDQQYTLTVTDLWTGTAKTFNKPLGSSCGEGDTSTFAEFPGLLTKTGDPVEGEAALQALAEFEADPAAESHVRAFSLPVAGKALPGNCTASNTALCLLNDRFRVETEFANPNNNGQITPAQTHNYSDVTGFFRFFGTTNLEVGVKVLDATEDFDHYWVFIGSTTGVAHTVTVTDTATGAIQTYPSGAAFCGVGDTDAFPEDPPLGIDQHPAAATVPEGAAANFGITASGGTPPYVYQWQFSVNGSSGWSNLSNGTGNISGATSANLTINPTVLANDGFYRCRVRDAEFPSTGIQVHSNSARLTVAPSLVISQQPVSQTVAPASNVGFSVIASGGQTPYTYRWQYSANGTSGWSNLNDMPFHISGATTANLSIDPVDPADAGWYRCRVRDANYPGTGSQVHSTAAQLTVTAPASCSPNATTLCLNGGRFRARLTYNNSGGNGQAASLTDVTGAFYFGGSGNAEVVVKVLDGTTENGHFWLFHGAMTDRQYTLTVTDLWTGLTRTYNKPHGTLCGEADTMAFPASGGGNAPVAYDDAASHFLKDVGTQALASGRSGTIPILAFPETTPGKAGTCSASNTALCLLGNRFRVTTDFLDPNNNNQSTAAQTHVYSDQSGFFKFFGTTNLEVGVKVLDATQAYGHYWVFIASLTSVSHNIRVTDTVTGAQNVYTPPAAFCGQADTQAFPADPELTIAQHPANRTVTAGGSASFSVGATGGQTPYVYQWQYSANGSSGWSNLSNATGNISGATSANLTVNPAQSSNDGWYRCRVRDATYPAAGGQVFSNNARLTVNPALAIAQHPANRTVTAGGSANFSVAATGGQTPYSYQWQYSANGSSGWSNLSNATSNISGATSSSLTVNPVQSSNDGWYRCRVRDATYPAAGGQVYSNSARLTVSAQVPNLQVKQGTTVLDHEDLVNFGLHEFGDTVNRSFTLKNIGSGTLTVSGISLTGSDRYSLSGISFPVNLTANQTRNFTVSITLNQADQGSQLAVMAIASNDDDTNPFNVNLQTSVPVLFLQNGRFQAEVTWSGSGSGDARAEFLTDDSGAFWFFGRRNAEVMVKVLDGTTFNGHYWVYHGSMTTLPYTLTITDLSTGIVQTYNKPAGSMCGGADTSSFPDVLKKAGWSASVEPFQDVSSRPGPENMSTVMAMAFPAGAKRAGNCNSSNTDLCLQEDRFRVEIEFFNPQTQQLQVARTHPYSQETGFFWFFGPDNIEIGIKILDDTGASGHFWVFIGSSTNVPYTITVTDTLTNQVEIYTQAGNQCGQNDTTTF